jgi:hypothetical protein
MRKFGIGPLDGPRQSLSHARLKPLVVEKVKRRATVCVELRSIYRRSSTISEGRLPVPS